jgi:hypothetical protein
VRGADQHDEHQRDERQGNGERQLLPPRGRRHLVRLVLGVTPPAARRHQNEHPNSQASQHGQDQEHDENVTDDAQGRRMHRPRR